MRLVAELDLGSMKLKADPSFKFRCLDNCGKCCCELDVPLTDEDIERIEELGYSAWEFVDYSKAFYRGNRFLGYALRKRPFDGCCVFLDPETRRCRIYDHRPKACRLYPFVFIRDGKKLLIKVRDGEECPGIGDPDGDVINLKFLMKNYGDIIMECRKKWREEKRAARG